MNYLDNVNIWKNYSNLDIELRNELDTLDEKGLEEAFYTDLEFGTGGLRGILGVGTNRMNIYTVNRATLGFGRYLSQFDDALNRGVVISHDNRHKSREFAINSARVLTKLGFKVYLFEDLRPTPELSFTVRYKHAIGGIMITASHNPKEYNGYKIYNEQGCQLLPEQANLVIDEILKIKDIFSVEKSDSDEGIEILGQAMDRIYIDDVKKIVLNPCLKKDFKVTYTPLHGTGQVFISDVLNDLGYDVYPVMEQMTKDPDFSNVKTSNPENKEAFDESIAYAEKIGAKLCLATDPDADRLGVAVLHDGKYVLLTGNQSAAIIFNYIVENKAGQNVNLNDNYLFTTIVSGTLPTLIANKYGIKVETTLTGFKYIGQKAEEIKDKGTYLFGFEESYGCLIRDTVRDKDSVQACIMLAEAAAYYYEKGQDLVDKLNELYEQYGYIEDGISNFVLKGIEGKKKINEIMDFFRYNDISLEGYQILAKEDYQTSKGVNFIENTKYDVLLPQSNVIKYYLNDDNWFVLRPSGTEPKLKVYYGTKGHTANETIKILESIKSQIESKVKNV